MGHVTGIGFHRMRARGTTDLAALRPRSAPGAVLARAWEARAGCVRQSLRHATLGVAMGPLARIDLDYDPPIGTFDVWPEHFTEALYAAGIGLVGLVGSANGIAGQLVRARKGQSVAASSFIAHCVSLVLGVAPLSYFIATLVVNKLSIADAFQHSSSVFTLGLCSLAVLGGGVALDRVNTPQPQGRSNP